jgi:hypothetical protein
MKIISQQTQLGTEGQSIETATQQCAAGGRAEKARIVQREEHNARLFATPLIATFGDKNSGVARWRPAPSPTRMANEVGLRHSGHDEHPPVCLRLYRL